MNKYVYIYIYISLHVACVYIHAFSNIEPTLSLLFTAILSHQPRGPKGHPRRCPASEPPRGKELAYVFHVHVDTRFASR